jgi:spore coat polysaccharide biosynthesis protein SpsF (cytidylyltransferase family)
MNFGIIIQARTGSTRLPKKVLANIHEEKNVLEFQITRILEYFNKKNLLIATTNHKNDKVIKNIAEKYKIKSYQGSENNVLKRYIDCATKYNIQNIIRITSDCPLIDPQLIKKMILEFKKKNIDYLSNTLPVNNSTYPDGSDIEIFKYNSLKKVNKLAKTKIEKEHVTNLFWSQKKIFKSSLIKMKQNLSRYKFSIDYKSELFLVKEIILELNRKNLNGTAKEIVSIIKKNNKLAKLSQNSKKKFINNRKDLY